MVLDIITYALCRKNGGSGTSANIYRTTTALTDGATTNPITVDGNDVTAVSGDFAIYNTQEFIFDGTQWNLLGDRVGLGEMAYLDRSDMGELAFEDTSDLNLGELAMKDTDDIHREISDVEYEALPAAKKNDGTEYFVYETEEDNRTITAYDSNGNFLYTLTMYGGAASDISLESKVTTPPSIVAPNPFGAGGFIFKGTFADGNTYYFNGIFSDDRTGYSVANYSERIADAYGTNLFFVINGNRFTLMSAPNTAWISSIHIPGYDESSFELAAIPKPNGFRRIYMGDELYATLNPTPIEEVSTITATTTEQSITFTEDCDYVWFRNLGDNDCYVSNHSNILIGADDVAIVKAGGGTRIAVPANKTVYIKSAQGTSVVEVHGQNSECAPFKPSGGTPNEYIKDATINSNTGSLTLTKKDGTTVVLPVSSVPAENSTTLINSDGIYRNTAGKRYYVQGSHAGGEIFNCYMGNGENVASGAYSHAEGFMTSALNGEDHAEGYGTTASGGYSHAEGQLTSVYSESGHAEGKYTKVGSAVVNPDTGETTYTGTGAAFSHAEGYTSVASGYTSHAEGYGTHAAGADSHAEGYSTQARGDGSHSEGYATIAAGGNSHAEGHTTLAQGLNSHAGGFHTQANTNDSTVIGRYNVADGTGVNDPKHLFIIGNGTTDNARSNILEVSDTYLNLNGIFKQNGQVIDFSTLGDEIVEMSDIEYDALATKDPDKVYFVYEAEEDNRSIVCKDSNGNWKYTTTIIGTTASDITDNVTAEESTVTTQPTPGFDYWYGNVVFQTTTPGGNVVYHSMFYFSNNGRAGMRDTASGDGAPDAYFELGTYGSITYHPTPSGSPVSGLYVFSSSHRDASDTIEFAVTPKSNGFRRIYKGDELYVSMTPSKEFGALAYKDTASGTAVTTVGTLPSLTYDSTTESFTFSAGTLPTTGTVTVS